LQTNISMCRACAQKWAC